MYELFYDIPGYEGLYQASNFGKIIDWFLDKKNGATVCISDPHEKGMTEAKILSRLACLQDRLTDHIE